MDPLNEEKFKAELVVVNSNIVNTNIIIRSIIDILPGGGAGRHATTGGNGGSGIVIIAYPTS